MKIYIKSTTSRGYLYIFKHGIGPGTLPRDVEVIRTKDLPNGYTAVWTDRFLTTSELKEYDIPSETEINRYLDRIGYCQKDGDVVPCDEVEACDTVTAAKSSKADILDSYAGKDTWLKAKLSQKAYFRRGYTGNEYWIRIVDKDENGNYIINRVSSYKEYKGNSEQKQKTLSNTYTVDKNSITLFNPIQTATTDEIFNVEACDKVAASSQSITSLMSPYADVLTSIGYDGKKFLNEVSSEYTYDELSDADDLHACICGFILNSDYINQEDASKLADSVINQVGNINACDTKYFANMVSASNDPELDDDFLIEGYYDNQRRGLAESAETSDVSALNELANEYANKGYYIVVYNLTDGVITEFSADNWFNDIAPDGGASLFMSW